MNIFEDVGQYVALMREAGKRPDKGKMLRAQVVREFDKIGLNSLGIVVIISFFFGAVIAMQTGLNMQNPLLPSYLVGLGTREGIILEFSSTVLSLILAGKVGSSIASEIGTMRVTDQIDALEVMGINSASHLIAPKLLAALLMFPLLTLVSMAFGIFGGWFAGIMTHIVSTQEYVEGLQYNFKPFFITYSLIKSVVFGFVVVSLASYRGYYAHGGALEVGKASTKGVVNSSLTILVFNLVLTHILLQ